MPRQYTTRRERKRQIREKSHQHCADEGSYAGSDENRGAVHSCR